MTKAFKFRYVNEITGVFVLAAVLVMGISVVLMGQSKQWFVRHKTFKILLPPAGSMGLRRGADVAILQTVVGSVDEISPPQSDGRMFATLSVRAGFADLLLTDSRVFIRRTAVIGDAYVDIDTQGSKGGPLPAEGTLIAKADVGPTELLQKTVDDIRKEIIPAIRQARLSVEEYGKFAADLRSPDSGFQQTLARVNRLSAGIERGEGLAGKLLADPAMAAEAERAVPKVNAALDEANAMLRDVHKNAAGVSDQTGQALEQVRALLADLQRTTATLPQTAKSIQQTAEGLPALVLQIQETTRQLQRLAEQIQRGWLVGGGGGNSTGSDGGRIRPENVGGGR